MPSLTVTEKEHWKERITRRLDKKIETLAASDPCMLDRLHNQARLRALQSLGLAEMQSELEAIAGQKKAQEKREKHLYRAMQAHLRHVPVEEIPAPYHDCLLYDVTGAIQKRQTVHEEELLAESEQGREILNLRREKDNLLDSVWLATSSVQIKQLWQKVAELLKDEQTPLQQESLAIGGNEPNP